MGVLPAEFDEEIEEETTRTDAALLEEGAEDMQQVVPEVEEEDVGGVASEVEERAPAKQLHVGVRAGIRRSQRSGSGSNLGAGGLRKPPVTASSRAAVRSR